MHPSIGHPIPVVTFCGPSCRLPSAAPSFPMKHLNSLSQVDLWASFAFLSHALGRLKHHRHLKDRTAISGVFVPPPTTPEEEQATAVALLHAAAGGGGGGGSSDNVGRRRSLEAASARGGRVDPRRGLDPRRRLSVGGGGLGGGGASGAEVPVASPPPPTAAAAAAAAAVAVPAPKRSAKQRDEASRAARTKAMATALAYVEQACALKRSI